MYYYIRYVQAGRVLINMLLNFETIFEKMDLWTNYLNGDSRHDRRHDDDVVSGSCQFDDYVSAVALRRVDVSRR